MAKDKGYIFPDPYNETNSGDEPDLSGAGLYVSYGEVIDAHLSQVSADLDSTPNSRSGDQVMGGPAPGEINPAKMYRPKEGEGRK